ncbi:MAG: plastocyanin/azurin family copper-binding protein [Gaiellaceae bacterium]
MRMLVVSLLVVGALLAGKAAAPAAGPQTITGTVGPGFTITLKQHGRVVRSLPPATYLFVIDDRSNIHNFHLSGPGVSKRTSVAAVGKKTWRLTLRRGTYRYVCDPHATTMKGKFTVQAP